MKDIITLGIESSCDETSASIVKNGREVLSNVINTQIPIHELFGGVVPEIASRNHVEAISTVAKTALKEAEIEYKDITLKQSLWIAMSQAIAAAFPGVSRSGITMTVGRGMGVKRESVAKYSFLLSTPIVAAAALYDLKDFVFNIPFFIGVLASFIVGVIVIKFLLEYLKKGSFKGFAIYRVILGLFIIGLCIIRL